MKAPPSGGDGDDDDPDLFNWRGKSLTEARKEFWDNAREGSDCPCCDRYGRVYCRRLNSGMAWWLIRFFRYCALGGFEGQFVDVRLVPGGIERAHKCEFEKLFYWKLVEPDPTQKEEGHRSGFWRLTLEGRDFALRRTKVMSHALDYDGRCLGLGGKLIDITGALRRKFDYDELIGWKPDFDS